MRYYQEGLDWNPKMISKNGGWLSKFADGGEEKLLPKIGSKEAYELEKAKQNRSESTKVVFKTAPLTEKEKAKNKEINKGTHENSKKYWKKQVEERAAKRKDPGTFSKGNYTIEEPLRLFPNSEGGIGQVFDEYMNPAYMIGRMASGLGNAGSKAYNTGDYSDLPLAIAEPLVAGAFGLDPLGSAMKVPGRVAQSMESGLLSNTYKLNPWAFKANPEAYYRGVGKEGIEDIFESGVIRSKKQNAYPEPYFSKGVIGDKYAKGYFAELTNEPMKGVGSFSTGDLIQTPVNTISINNPNLKLYQKDWLRGYKEVPKKLLDLKETDYMSLLAPKGNMYGQNQVLVQQSRLLNPKIKDKFFKNQAPKSGPKESILQKMPADYSNRITPENYEDFVNRVHSSTDYNFASAPKTGANLGIGNYGKPGMVYKDAPLNNLGKDIINAHEKNHGIFAGTLSKEMSNDLLKPFGTNKPVPFYQGKHQADEVLARMGQFKNAVGIGDNQTFTLGHLNLIRKNYANSFIDNGITEMLKKIKPGSQGEKEFLKNMNKYALGTLPIGIGVSALQQKKQGGVVKDDMGYWNPDNHGKIVEISSPDITMEGVDQPLLGISDTGDTKLMQPGENYKFKGKKVTEYPVAQNGKRQPIYTNDPRKVQSYNDSLNLYKAMRMQDELMGDNKYGKPLLPASAWTVQKLKEARKRKIVKGLEEYGPIGDDFQNEKDMFKDNHFATLNDKKLIKYYKSLGFTDDNIMYHTSADLVHPKIKAIGSYFDGSAQSPVYKKPVQPYILQEESDSYKTIETSPSSGYFVKNKPKPVIKKQVKEKVEEKQITPAPIEKEVVKMEEVVKESPRVGGRREGVFGPNNSLIGYMDKNKQFTPLDKTEEWSMNPGDRRLLQDSAQLAKYLKNTRIYKQGGKIGVNQQDEKTLEQLDQLTNFTNYNKPQPGGWLNKYN
jgi:hypothetical protein